MKSKILKLAHLGNPILRKKAKPVRNPRSPQVKKLIADMIKTVGSVSAVGIAAPQVSSSLQLFIISSDPIPAYPKAPHIPPTAIINPKIISKSKKLVKDWEGCLSIPGLRGLVLRHTSITVEYTDAEGKHMQNIFTDFVARVFQHEFDHINGIVFTDRTDPADLMTEAEYMKMMRAKRIARSARKNAIRKNPTASRK